MGIELSNNTSVYNYLFLIYVINPPFTRAVQKFNPLLILIQSVHAFSYFEILHGSNVSISLLTESSLPFQSSYSNCILLRRKYYYICPLLGGIMWYLFNSYPKQWEYFCEQSKNAIRSQRSFAGKIITATLMQFWKNRKNHFLFPLQIFSFIQIIFFLKCVRRGIR